MAVTGGGGGGGGGLKQQARWSTVSDDLMAAGCCANLNSSILPNFDAVGWLLKSKQLFEQDHKTICMVGFLDLPCQAQQALNTHILYMILGLYPKQHIAYS
jgi:hypothetical protein